MTEDQILGIGGENINGAYAMMKYFQSLDDPSNKALVEAFKAMWGDVIVIGDVTQAAYLGPWLWKAAVEKAGAPRLVFVRVLTAAVSKQTGCFVTFRLGSSAMRSGCTCA